MINTTLQHTPEILFITSYPPRVCGIATYSQDLINALSNKFDHSFSSSICALESEKEVHSYPQEVRYILDTSNAASYLQTAIAINNNPQIQIVMLQHEFGLFDSGCEAEFIQFIDDINKPVIITFHTVLPSPDTALRVKVNKIVQYCSAVVVMTQNAADILVRDYEFSPDKINIISHGVHLVPHSNKKLLKGKYGLSKRTVLSTFGLISSGKSIETSLEALPAIIRKNPEVLFLVIGKTHPNIIKNEGEAYREALEDKVNDLGLQQHVQFINYFLPLTDLLEYLQLTDIYLFTSSDPNQAVSGTFSYAISCGCPVVSTPIPHAKEVLKDDAGIIFDFGNSAQLADAVILLLNNKQLRTACSNNGLQRIVSSAWENVSISNANLFNKINSAVSFQFKVPELNLNHIKHLTTPIGMIQFSRIDQPDISTGYTLDDNARALAALVTHFKHTGNQEDLPFISTYLTFIKYCQQKTGNFLNYVDEQQNFTEQNFSTNLEDANGRAIWALGVLIANKHMLPAKLFVIAEKVFIKALPHIENMHSTRAMAFALKGLYYYSQSAGSADWLTLVKILAQRLVQMYKHEGELGWEWFEGYLTYGNSILPEALLCAHQLTGNAIYKEIAHASFAFLLRKTFNSEGIKVISNQQWLQKGKKAALYGEQPIDIAYTILALRRFYEVFEIEEYLQKMKIAFNWFLGNNHLQQIIYNPCTGGCFDGLEQYQVNLNQGAESTVSYLMARLAIDEYLIDLDTLKGTPKQKELSAKFNIS